MKLFTLFILLILNLSYAQDNSTQLSAKLDSAKTVTKNWADRVQFRGYTQFRYNRLFETNDKLVCDQCDKSLGDNNGFFLRRARMIFFGEMDNVYFYIQPDLASSAADQNYNQLRDLYFDIALVPDKTHRIRLGQSKVPYGFENLQSSSNRLTPDRNDALNSAVANERDIGVTYYWASAEKRKLLAELTKNNLKGTGDYGIFGLGLYNGQTANKTEKNDNLHVVSRFTYPFKLSSGQVIEPSLQAYHGKFVSNTSTTSTANNQEFDDNRVAATLVYYPQPFGFQAEYNVGRGPRFDVAQGQVINDELKGGYVQLMYNHQYGSSYLMPFIKAQYYDGGKKQEAGVPDYLVREYELGVEWQASAYIELTATYAYGDRRVINSNTAVADREQDGSRLRLQMQINY